MAFFGLFWTLFGLSKYQTRCFMDASPEFIILHTFTIGSNDILGVFNFHL